MAAATALISHLGAPPARRAAVRWLLLGCAVFCLGDIYRESSGGHLWVSDISRFREIGLGSGLPYRDHAVEYPPLAVALMKGLAALAPGRQAFGSSFTLAMSATGLAGLWLVGIEWGRAAAATLTVLATPLIAVLVTRFDVLSVTLALAAVVLQRRGRPGLAGLALAGSVGVKLWALPLVALLALRCETEARRRAFLAAVATGLMIVAGLWLAPAGPDGLRQVLSFRGAHGWQVESALGSLVRLLAPASIHLESGAARFGAVPSGLAPTLSALGLAGAVAFAWTAGRLRGAIGAGWVGAVAALMLSSTVLSPQYVLWLLPGAAIAATEGATAVTLAVAAVSLATSLEVLDYHALLRGTTGGQALVIARNLLLGVAMVTAARHLTRARGATVG
ncbi:MAG TPA: glycosyltransferase 87 family protein [Solirubrobacteraceae bacterium]|jgi:hypothetical protein|nr:glycosyltransferase 87 family protein [Solirubrobacteraceae bacterium]